MTWLEGIVARLRPSPTRRPELDGLRGIAILLVLWAHLLTGVSPHAQPFLPGMPNLLPGGGLTGVQLFFVLSGYLITTILMRGIADSGIRSFGRFYMRRARRLLPALIGICAAYALIVVIFYQGESQRLGAGSILAALTYTSNLPLFDTDGWLGHTWSLAVEEQFYVVWPIVLFAALKLGRRFVIAIVIASIIGTDVLRNVLAITDNSSWTLLRWDALMIGALIALVPLRVHWFAGVVGFAVLGYFSVTEVTYQSEVYIVTAVASAAVLLAAPQHRWLRNPLLQYFGLISYGLYLWHMFVMRFGWPPPVALVLSIIAATVSYVVVELRFLDAAPAPAPRDAG
jgi:peptidoglycan/LPS O-acetylase OafA/YrhL